jgi:hypothetical protein
VKGAKMTSVLLTFARFAHPIVNREDAFYLCIEYVLSLALSCACKGCHLLVCALIAHTP